MFNYTNIGSKLSQFWFINPVRVIYNLLSFYSPQLRNTVRWISSLFSHFIAGLPQLAESFWILSDKKFLWYLLICVSAQLLQKSFYSFIRTSIFLSYFSDFIFSVGLNPSSSHFQSFIFGVSLQSVARPIPQCYNIIFFRVLL